MQHNHSHVYSIYSCRKNTDTWLNCVPKIFQLILKNITNWIEIILFQLLTFPLNLGLKIAIYCLAEGIGQWDEYDSPILSLLQRYISWYAGLKVPAIMQEIVLLWGQLQQPLQSGRSSTPLRSWKPATPPTPLDMTGSHFWLHLRDHEALQHGYGTYIESNSWIRNPWIRRAHCISSIKLV